MSFLFNNVSILPAIGSVAMYAGSVGTFTPTTNVLNYVVYSSYHNEQPAYTATISSSGTTVNTLNINTATGGYIALSGTQVVNGVTYDNTNVAPFTVVLTGYIKCDYTGTWTFTLVSDDGSYMWIGPNALAGYTPDNCFINNGLGHGMTPVSATVSLVSGNYYPIRILSGNSGGGGGLQFSFARNGTTYTNGTGFFYQGTITNTILPGWLICDGSAYSKTAYGNLFSVIGTTYGTSYGTDYGSTIFNVPNLTNKFIYGASSSTSYGISGGNNIVTLAVANIPSHNHGGTTGGESQGHTHSFTNRQFVAGYLFEGGTQNYGAWGREGPYNINSGNVSQGHYHNFTTDSTGSTKPFSILPAYTMITFIIKY